MKTLIWCLGLPALLVAAMYAWGHDPTGHDFYHDWYLAQRQPNNISPCCGTIAEEGGDAHFVDVKADGDKYYVFIDGQWMEYPWGVQPYKENPTGHNVVWYKKLEGGYAFFCLRLAAGS